MANPPCEDELEVQSTVDQNATAELDYIIRSRCPIIYIESIEEQKMVQRLRDYCSTRNKKLVVWDCSDGASLMVTQNDGSTLSEEAQLSLGPIPFLDWVDEDRDIPESKDGSGGGAVYVMKDIHDFLPGSMSNNQSMMDNMERELKRKFRSMVARDIQYDRKVIILLAPDRAVPSSLREDIRTIQWPLPTTAEIRQYIDELVSQLLGRVKNLESIDAHRKMPEFSPDTLDEMARAYTGMSRTRIQQVFKENSVRQFDMTPEERIERIIAAKQDIIRDADCGLEYIPTETLPDMSQIGGLDVLKQYINDRQEHFSEEARDYGLPHLKGLLLIGIQGCGKSMSAKAIGKSWRLPTLRLDVGAIFTGLVGGSENRMRRAIRYMEAMAPCVVWIDEIEKSMAGVGSSDRSDAGTAARVFSTMLTWMSDKTVPVYVVATANDVSSLPPELIRSGRFDQRFFVNLPTQEEREEILTAHIDRRGRNPEDFDIEKITQEMFDFSGAEIEQCFVDAMTRAFADDHREVNTDDVIIEAHRTFPLAETMVEKVRKLREWARERCAPASEEMPIQDIQQRKKKRSLELASRNDSNAPGEMDDVELLPHENKSEDQGEGPDLG